MTREAPIACSLDASEYPARLAAMAEIGAIALRSAAVSADRVALRFEAREEVRDQLAAIVAAESRCCSFLRMHLTNEAGGVLSLEINAPPGAEPILREIVAAFRGEQVSA